MNKEPSISIFYHLNIEHSCMNSSLLKSITGSTRLVFYPHGDPGDAYNGLRFVLSISPVILDRVPSRPNDGPQAGDQAQAVGGGRRPPARPAPAF